MKKSLAKALLFFGIFGILFLICFCVFCVEDNRKISVYANSITLANCPRQIDLYIENRIKLDDDFLIVSPIDYNMGIKVEILDSNYNETNGIEIRDNIITPHMTGCFYVRFIAEKASAREVNDVLKINVLSEIDDELCYLKPISTYFSAPTGEIFNLSDTVNGYNRFLKSVKFEIEGEEVDSNFIPTKEGAFEVTSYLEMTGYRYITNFTLEVKDVTGQTIKLYDEGGEEIFDGDEINVSLSSKVLFISFEVVDGLSQVVSAKSSDESIAIAYADAPIIVVELKKEGNVTITLTKGEFSVGFNLNIVD